MTKRLAGMAAGRTGCATVGSAVEKAVLAMVDQMEAEAAKKEEVLAIAHDENISAWIEATARWLRTTASEQVQFAQLCQGLGMPPIEIWLGVGTVAWTISS